MDAPRASSAEEHSGSSSAEPLLDAAAAAEEEFTPSNGLMMYCLRWFGFVTRSEWLASNLTQNLLQLLWDTTPYFFSAAAGQLDAAVVAHRLTVMYCMCVYFWAQERFRAPYRTGVSAFFASREYSSAAAVVDAAVSAPAPVADRALETACDAHCVAAFTAAVGPRATVCFHKNFGPTDLACVQSVALRRIFAAAMRNKTFAETPVMCFASVLASASPFDTEFGALSAKLCVPETLGEYKLRAEHSASFLRVLEEKCSRVFRCYECALCPAVGALMTYDNATLLPPLTDANQPVSSVPAEFQKCWQSHRCIHSPATLERGMVYTYNAVMWYFGGVTTALQTFYTLVEKHADSKRALLISATQAVLDVVVSTYTHARTLNAVELDVRRRALITNVRSGFLYSSMTETAVQASLESM